MQFLVILPLGISIRENGDVTVSYILCRIILLNKNIFAKNVFFS